MNFCARRPLLHRSPLFCFWLLSGSTPKFSPIFPISWSTAALSCWNFKSLRHGNKFVYQIGMLQCIVSLFPAIWFWWYFGRVSSIRGLVNSLASKTHANFKIEIISLATGLPCLLFLACLARHGWSKRSRKRHNPNETQKDKRKTNGTPLRQTPSRWTPLRWTAPNVALFWFLWVSWMNCGPSSWPCMDLSIVRLGFPIFCSRPRRHWDRWGSTRQPGTQNVQMGAGEGKILRREGERGVLRRGPNLRRFGLCRSRPRKMDRQFHSCIDSLHPSHCEKTRLCITPWRKMVSSRTDCREGFF